MSFIVKSKNITADWPIDEAKTLNLANFCTETAYFYNTGTGSIGLSSNKVSKAQYSYDTEYFDEDDVSHGTLNILIYSPDEFNVASRFADLQTITESDDFIGLFIEDGTAEHTAADDVYTVKFNCKLAKDSFNVTFKRAMVTVANYSNDVTFNAMEDYLEGRPLLN